MSTALRRPRIAHPWSGLQGLPREVWALCATSLVNRAGTMALVFLVLYLTRLGWSPRAAGLLMSAYGVGSVIASPIGGWLADRIGAPRVLISSLFLSGAFLLVYPWVESVPALVVLTLAWSLSSEAYRPASFALISAAVATERRKVAFSANRLAVNLGASIGPALGGFLAGISMRVIFLVDGLTSLAAGVLLAMLLRRMPAHTRAPARPAAASRRFNLGLLADRRLALFLACTLPINIAFFQVLSTLPLDLVRGHGLPEQSYGLMLALNSILIVFIELPLSARTAAWPHGRALALGTFLIAAGLGLTAFAHDVVSLAATVVVWTFGEMILFPTGTSFVAETALPERRGEALGLYTGTFGLAFLLAPVIGTAVLERWGADRVWLGSFLAGLLAAVLLLRVDSMAPRREAPAA